MLTGLAQEASAGGGGGFGGMLPFILILFAIFAVPWFLNNRKNRTMGDMRSTLAPGDEVMTGSGLFATVVRADGDVMVLETSPGVEQRWARAAIVRKVGPPLPEVCEETDDVRAEDQPDLDASDIDEFEVPDDVSSLDPDIPDDKKS
ncbi:MAG: preprotein translocase subunit YajC [Micrococcales bacterium]|nr:preprotein translocase subunit YajC [Micrococcales bacterium]MCL2666446.1 preprotein translocase subunit YajC [Micrococcales bacterium]